MGGNKIYVIESSKGSVRRAAFIWVSTAKTNEQDAHCVLLNKQLAYQRS